MNSPIYFCLLLFVVAGFLNAAAQTGIQFHQGTLDEALARAEAEGKYVFVDAYTEWCGPCKWMAANAFKDPRAADLFNSTFVNYQMDMEKGEGPAVGKKYEVTAYPTLFFLNGRGALVEKAVGARETAGLIELGERVKSSQFVTLPQLHARFAEGDHDWDFLYTYLNRLYEGGLNTDAALAVYRDGMKGGALLEKKNWEIFDKLMWEIDTEEFQYFTANYAAFVERYGKGASHFKVTQAYVRHAIYATERGDDVAFVEGMRSMEAIGIADIAVEAQRIRVIRQQLLKDYAGLVDAMNVLVSKYDFKNAMELNNFAWAVYEGTDDVRHLRAALAWAERSVALQPDYYNLDTQAMLLHKLGHTKKAIAAAEAAVAAAKESGADCADTQAALDRWR